MQAEGTVIQGHPAVIFTLVGKSGQEKYSFNFEEGGVASACTDGSIMGQTVTVNKIVNERVMTVTIAFLKSE